MKEIIQRLETSTQIAHRRIDEICDLEIELINTWEEEQLTLSQNAALAQLIFKDQFDHYWPIIKKLLNGGNLLMDKRMGKQWFNKKYSELMKKMEEQHGQQIRQ